MSKSFEQFITEFQHLKKSKTDFVVVTLVKIEGSAPQDLGARMLVTSQGRFFGSVGGGKIETRCIEEAQKILADHSSLSHIHHEWNLQTDIKMTCGGRVGFLFELHRAEPSWVIAVFGAGHVGQELVPLLAKLECRLICIDPREEWLTRLPSGALIEKVHTATMAEVVNSLPQNAFVVCVTMGHAFDLPILHEALNRDFAYVGAIGSEQKAKVLRRDLLAKGLSEAQVSKLVCPIGENIGSNAPAEIAISIAAQLLRRRDVD